MERSEKIQFNGKSLAYMKTEAYVDNLLSWKDEIKKVADDSGLRLSYLAKDILDMLGFFDDSVSAEEEVEE